MRIGFAGAGKMAAAMARGWAGAEQPPESMMFADAGSGRAAALAKEVGCDAVESVGDLPGSSDVIVLAVKRTALDEVAGELGEDLPALISVLAGVPVARVQEAFPDIPVVLRAIPNLAVEVRRGVICYVPPGDSGERPGAALVGLLGHLGTVCPVEDELIDAATAIMSCSPAYFAVFSQALVEAAGREGFDPRLAGSLVAETLIGTGELLGTRAAESIRDAVASPGGATEAGLDALAERDFESAVDEAVRASLGRMRT